MLYRWLASEAYAYDASNDVTTMLSTFISCNLLISSCRQEYNFSIKDLVSDLLISINGLQNFGELAVLLFQVSIFISAIESFNDNIKAATIESSSHLLFY